jgi:hypothetical protein
MSTTAVSLHAFGVWRDMVSYLSPKGGHGKAESGSHCGSRAATFGVRIWVINTQSLASSWTPAISDIQSPKIRPFGHVRFAQDNNPSLPKPTHQSRLLFWFGTEKRKRTGRSMQRVFCNNIVFYENGYTVQYTDGVRSWDESLPRRMLTLDLCLDSAPRRVSAQFPKRPG